MARIRTIKPEFFTHYDLYLAEKETGLPIRVAFSGLWTQADREGRFKWIPQQLKLGCLPYDEVDFSRVLHALATRDFICKYEVDGVNYGHISGFLDHQVINNRERQSSIPAPNESNTLTRRSRVTHASLTREVHAQAEGKGRERKGREGKEGSKEHATNHDGLIISCPEDFEPNEQTKTKAHLAGCRTHTRDDIISFTSHYQAKRDMFTIDGWQAKFLAWMVRQKQYDMRNAKEKTNATGSHNSQSGAANLASGLNEAFE